MSRRSLPLAATALAALAMIVMRADGYQLYVVSLLGLTTIVGVGLNVLVGLSGQISLGHAAFYAIGAYVVGILTTSLAWSFWIALPLATLAAAAAGGLVAIPALRVRGPYLAMVTISFGFVIEQGTVEWKSLTGGWSGLQGIPLPDAFGVAFSERASALMILALTAATILLYARLADSPWGKAMRAVRDSEVASQSIGLDPVLIRTTAFAISAAVAGAAGGVFASVTSFISPDSFPFLQSIIFLLVVMIGGTGRTFGPLVGASVVVLLPEFLAELAQYRLLFVGLILLLALRLTLIITPELKVVTLLGRWPARAADLLRRLTWAPRPGRPRVNGTAQATLDIAAFLRTGARQLTLSVESLSVSFGGVRAVQNLSFEAPPGKITTLIGPNGAGKSTVLNLISGHDRPDRGVVRLGVEMASGRPTHQLARAGIARTYQTAQLFGHMSALDNVMTALNRGYLEPASLFRPDRDPARRLAAESLLAFVGYRGPLDRLAAALPHAEMRLVEIARALATRPTVLALDEPAAGLPTTDRERLSALLVAVARLGIAVILVEHDMGLVMRVSDRVIVLDAGVRIADGAPGDIAANPAVRRAYLGEEGRVDRARRTTPATQVRTVLAADALAASYGAVSVLYDVDLSVAEGEFVAVLGANGAGKSTLTRALSGLLRPVSGTIRLRDRPLQGEPAHSVAAHGLILVPEGRQIFPELSVIDNLRLGGYLRPRGDLAAQIELLLKRFPPLARRLRQRAGLLSGGEQQMLAIARGLMARPSVLMLDEPSLGLAPKLVEDVYDLLMEIRDEGTTILLVDQMAVMALSIADRAYVLQSGVIRHSGPATRLRNDPELVRAFLGVSARNVVEGEQPWISS